MKPIGVLYATREGHTSRIAERVASAFRTAGFEAEVRNLETTTTAIDLGRYSAAILAASVHAGNHESVMLNFTRQHRHQLEAMPNAFLSVTLSQVGAQDASKPPGERAKFAADVESMLLRFRQQTGWTPQQTKPVGGALPYSKYNFLIRFIMKRIARKAGAPTDTSRDYDFTDWNSLDAFASGFAADLPRLQSPAAFAPLTPEPAATSGWPPTNR